MQKMQSWQETEKQTLQMECWKFKQSFVKLNSKIRCKVEVWNLWNVIGLWKTEGNDRNWWIGLQSSETPWFQYLDFVRSRFVFGFMFWLHLEVQVTWKVLKSLSQLPSFPQSFGSKNIHHIRASAHPRIRIRIRNRFLHPFTSASATVRSLVWTGGWALLVGQCVSFGGWEILLGLG